MFSSDCFRFEWWRFSLSRQGSTPFPRLRASSWNPTAQSTVAAVWCPRKRPNSVNLCHTTTSWRASGRGCETIRTRSPPYWIGEKTARKLWEWPDTTDGKSIIAFQHIYIYNTITHTLHRFRHRRPQTVCVFQKRNTLQIELATSRAGRQMMARQRRPQQSRACKQM